MPVKTNDESSRISIRRSRQRIADQHVDDPAASERRPEHDESLRLGRGAALIGEVTESGRRG
jgi:hypothetical protein